MNRTARVLIAVTSGAVVAAAATGITIAAMRDDRTATPMGPRAGMGPGAMMDQGSGSMMDQGPGAMMGQGSGMGMGGMHGMASGMHPDTSSAATIPGAREVAVQAREFGFEPATVTVRTGEQVNLVLRNTGRVYHDLVIEGLGVHVGAEAGGTATAGVRAPDEPGTYTFECTVAGHADAGMRGTLTVTAG